MQLKILMILSWFTMNKKKRIMILGAGNAVYPLIKVAKKTGYEVVVVSVTGDYPGIKIADYFVECDIRNTTEILKHAKRLKIDGITSAGTDVVVPTIGRVVDELQLHGTGADAALLCSDKWLMKERLLQANVNVACGFQCINEEEVFEAVQKIGFPLMCKPSDSSGSQGVSLVKTESELNDALKQAIILSSSKTVILEQYLNGIEFGAQVVVSGNEITHIFFHDDQMTDPPLMIPIGHSMPCTLSDEILEKAKIQIVKAISTLGIRDVIANIDVMLVGNEPFIIEIGARIGATCLPETISIYGSFDAYSILLDLALGNEVKIPELKVGIANASRLLFSSKTGILNSIEVPEELSKLEPPSMLRIYAKLGDKVSEFTSGPKRIGDILVTGETAEQAIQLAKTYAVSVKFQLS
jgi:biotin carboxylase